MVYFKREEKVEDRRADLRFPIKVKAAIKGANGLQCLGVTENISTSGTLIKVSQSTNADNLQMGDAVSLALMVGVSGHASPIVCQCKVMHLCGRGIGLRFQTLSADALERLEQLIMSNL
jgi:hypothetical protein